ncbi:uncharacterized protein VDAG_04799 [Verticillium dahliae VdLs.17]|uniref:Uncharacterized protein n=1 Tax=Verticillium dahliae (strain VdLs.17 / ATCC MYA-4575 / FGSC 10137) TaxID=498257 RepID=G2X462_VERDV|nr:uncharacterized protein VDAG_04799 [Verticillium dahliae VdLs.17]EGY23361.1 hypothetical protein VDAG_04799 [Verticillium dahliae VdLs.17]KAH6691954.1 hypothetical protein EV126DRAFT_390799 [Verticillium dahliae]
MVSQGVNQREDRHPLEAGNRAGRRQRIHETGQLWKTAESGRVGVKRKTNK